MTTTNTNWSSGYTTGLEYTYGFFAQQSPDWLNYICLLNGIRPVDLGRPVHYCELGSGNGTTTAVLAETNPNGQFYAVDFNPTHIANARHLTNAAGISNAHFSECAFADLPSQNFPEFDFITLHGIWSWINADNRGEILRFIQRHLKPNGIVYVSYNALPGWAGRAPIQHLMRTLAQSRSGEISSTLSQSILDMKQIAESGALFFQQDSTSGEFIDQLKQMDPRYLAHEYLNQDWQPFYHDEVAGSMAEAKLEYVGSASALMNQEALTVPNQLQELLRNMGRSALRETVRDYCLNTTFRTDVYCKSGGSARRRFDPNAYEGLWLFKAPEVEAWKTELRFPAGQITLSGPVVTHILHSLDAGPIRIKDIVERGKSDSIQLLDVAKIVNLLIASKQLLPSFAGPLTKNSIDHQPSVQGLNALILEDVFAEGRYRVLSSPSLRSGVVASSLELACLKAVLEHGVEDAESWIMDRVSTQSLKDEQSTDQIQIQIKQEIDALQRFKLARYHQLGIVSHRD